MNEFIPTPEDVTVTDREGQDVELTREMWQAEMTESGAKVGYWEWVDYKCVAMSSTQDRSVWQLQFDARFKDLMASHTPRREGESQ
jgi:hypothetical protein